MRDEIKGIVPKETSDEAITALEGRAKYLRGSWNLRELKTAQRIASFLAIDEFYLNQGRPFARMPATTFAYLLDQSSVDLNELLALCLQKDVRTALKAGRCSHQGLIKHIVAQNERLEQLKKFKQQVDGLNGAPYGAFGLFAPTGVKPMAKHLENIAALMKKSYPIAADAAERSTADSAIDAAEHHLYDTANDRLSAPTSSVPGAGRSGYVQALYETIKKHYAAQFESGASEEKGYQAPTAAKA